MLFVLPFPVIDPVLVAIGPFAIRWYALAYIVSLLVGWRYARRLAERPPAAASVNEVDDFLLWATLGVILGGRLGYVLFYNTAFYLAEPLAVLQVWHGGMSYHGGMLGVIAAGALFCHKRQLSFLLFMDRIACVVPIGLFLGRLANFINGELFGRVSDVPWAMVFPRGGPEPRHPSQLYEAALEGVLLFVLLWALQRNERVRESGVSVRSVPAGLRNITHAGRTGAGAGCTAGRSDAGQHHGPAAVASDDSVRHLSDRARTARRSHLTGL